ncbi:hypothetical protein JZ751_000623 [Albula glossodonta]|uniref:Uncharacterized protein n=1 Tax=Albula glossodonta TaxID=121402 RepID=A0A8T2PW98_9TELE|nr:hypothetical protein JZ751_000623 [Albula glossodonta]
MTLPPSHPYPAPALPPHILEAKPNHTLSGVVVERRGHVQSLSRTPEGGGSGTPPLFGHTCQGMVTDCASGAHRAAGGSVKGRVQQCWSAVAVTSLDTALHSNRTLDSVARQQHQRVCMCEREKVYLFECVCVCVSQCVCLHLSVCL